MENTINSFRDMKIYISCKYLFIYFVRPCVLFGFMCISVASIFIINIIGIDFRHWYYIEYPIAP